MPAKISGSTVDHFGHESVEGIDCTDYDDQTQPREKYSKK